MSSIPETEGLLESLDGLDEFIDLEVAYRDALAESDAADAAARRLAGEVEIRELLLEVLPAWVVNHGVLVGGLFNASGDRKSNIVRLVFAIPEKELAPIEVRCKLGEIAGSDSSMLVEVERFTVHRPVRLDPEFDDYVPWCIEHFEFMPADVDWRSAQSYSVHGNEFAGPLGQAVIAARHFWLEAERLVDRMAAEAAERECAVEAMPGPVADPTVRFAEESLDRSQRYSTNLQDALASAAALQSIAASLVRLVEVLDD